MMKQLWNDEAGFLVSAELVLVATILVIGVISGLLSVRDAVITELADVGGAIGSINQSFALRGTAAHSTANAGSGFNDLVDFCDASEGASNVGNSRCLAVGQGATGESPAGL